MTQCKQLLDISDITSTSLITQSAVHSSVVQVGAASALLDVKLINVNHWHS
jgi:hypothetical protein